MKPVLPLLCVLFCCMSFCPTRTSITASDQSVNMRIVDEPTSYSWQQNNNNPSHARLQMRVTPSPFSGPEHLNRLLHKCFTQTIDKYEYKFCPFANLTQKEVNTNSWNPYHGILGVWQEWTIKDNHFSSMMMLMGDQCGVSPRQTEVKLECGPKSELKSMSEPKHCEYELIFSTPLTCHNDSLLVYPTLSKDLQHQWNLLFGELHQQLITEKGYEKELNKIFQSAGYKLKPPSEAAPKQEAKAAPAHSAETNHNAGESNSNVVTHFTSLDSCNAGYESLKEELEATKAQLQRFL